MFFSEHCGKPPYAIASKPLIDEASSYAAFVCAIICAVLGVAGNVATSVVLLGDRSIRRHSTTPFLVSLAISDLIFSGFNLPLLAMRFYYRDWPMSYNTCLLFPFFFYANIIISSFSMAFIALNRFVGIYHAQSMPRLFTQLKSWIMVVAIWVTALSLMALPLSETWGQMGLEPATFSCTVLPKDDHSPMVFLVVVGMLLPCVTMITCYGLILWRVRQTGRAMRHVIPADEAEPALTRDRSIRHMTLKRERQLTRTLLILCTGFLICFLPTSLLMVFDPMPPCYKNPELHVAFYVVFWCSAFINPVIYTLSNRTYRRAFLFYLRRFTCRDPGSPATTWYENTPPDSMAMRSTKRREGRDRHS